MAENLKRPKRRTKVKFAPMPGGILSKAQASTAERVILSLQEMLGKVRPQDLVEASRPRRAPLHDLFTWDQNLAAERWREAQAKHIIRSIRIVVIGTPADKQVVVRTFPSVKDHDEKGRPLTPGYVCLGTVLETPR